MVRKDGVDERIAWSPTERVVRVPDPDERRPGGLRASVAPWMIFFAVGVVVAVVAFVLILSGSGGPDQPPPQASGTGQTTEPDLNGFRTKTVNVDDGFDALALAQTGGLFQYHGAPVTGDGVTVAEVFGPDTFTVTSPTGARMLVYLAPLGEPDLPVVTEGQEVTFIGTLMPVRPDFSFLVGPTAATAATSGVYVYAVPQTVRIVTE